MINVGAGVPFTPERRPRQSSAEWMRGYRDRLAAQRVSPGQAAEQVGQNADLGRTWEAHRDRRERRIIGRGRVSETLSDAATDNAVKRYLAGRSEVLGLIARAQQRAIPNIGYASRGSAAERRELAEIGRSSGHADCADCRRYGASPAESAAIHGGEIYR
jgi:hypothetical protein